MNNPSYSTRTVINLALLASILLFYSTGCRRESRDVPQTAHNSIGTSPPQEVVPLTNMVLIRAGKFIRIKHEVTLTRDFWIGRYEVTQREYELLNGRNPSHFKGDLDRPVEKLSYFDAEAFCAALTEREQRAGRLPVNYEYRLPWEAEWEYACRAGSTQYFSFGNSNLIAADYAWTAENADSQTHPVGQKRPNPWGLHDMHGNVWEWCRDWFEPYPPAAATNPTGPATGKFKVFRGGGWNNEADFARSANRFMMAPSNGIHFVGFRIVLSPKQFLLK